MVQYVWQHHNSLDGFCCVTPQFVRHICVCRHHRYLCTGQGIKRSQHFLDFGKMWKEPRRMECSCSFFVSVTKPSSVHKFQHLLHAYDVVLLFARIDCSLSLIFCAYSLFITACLFFNVPERWRKKSTLLGTVMTLSESFADIKAAHKSERAYGLRTVDARQYSDTID